MLVLSRRQGESIMIGNGICVTVVSLAGDRIRVGIDAPRDVPVHRSEVREMLDSARATDAQNRQTVQSGEPAITAGSAPASTSAGGAQGASSDSGTPAAAAAPGQTAAVRTGSGELLRGLRHRWQSIWQRIAARRQSPTQPPHRIPPEDVFFG